MSTRERERSFGSSAPGPRSLTASLLTLAACSVNPTGSYEVESHGAAMTLQMSTLGFQLFLRESGEAILRHTENESFMRVAFPLFPESRPEPLPDLHGHWHTHGSDVELVFGSMRNRCEVESQRLLCREGGEYRRVSTPAPAGEVERTRVKSAIPAKGERRHHAMFDSTQRGKKLAVSVSVDPQRGQVLASVRSLSGERVIVFPTEVELTFANETWPLISYRVVQHNGCDSSATRQTVTDLLVAEYAPERGPKPSSVLLRFACATCATCTDEVESDLFVFESAHD